VGSGDAARFARGGKGEEMSTGITFPTFNYLLGPEYPVSSWVFSYGFVEYNIERGGSGERGLLVEYLTTDAAGKNKRTVCFYPNTTESDYKSMDAASSKGKWVHANIFKAPYREI
jgi:hypothetical protein